jgi:peptide chain release factor 2
MKLDLRDVEFTAFRSGGPGGQHKNKTETAIRARHVPTGVVVVSCSERSQTQNKQNAVAQLAARLARLASNRRAAARAEARAAKPDASFGGVAIRTIRLVDSPCVIDHRTGHEEHDTRAVLRGRIDGFISACMRSRT